MAWACRLPRLLPSLFRLFGVDIFSKLKEGSSCDMGMCIGQSKTRGRCTASGNENGERSFRDRRETDENFSFFPAEFCIPSYFSVPS